MPGKIYDSEKNKAYKRYVILTEEEGGTEKDKTSLLLYIGRHGSVLDLLRAHFDLVMHVLSPEEAFPASNQKIVFQPNAIISDSSLHFPVLQSLLTASGRQELLQSIPLILVQTGTYSTSGENMLNAPKVDEVILSDKLSSKQIADKVAFWIKLKSALHSFNQEKKIILPDLYSQGAAWSLHRAVDIFIASIGLVIAIPVMAVIALLIKLDSRGPIFYIAPRAGRGYRVFSFFKFRTMIVGADDRQRSLLDQNEYILEDPSGALFFKMKNDPRATRIGQWLRKTSLDELPQLFNVLRGDISLIGNRPLPLEEASTLTTDKWSGRFLPPAGIVSLWHIQKSDRSKPSATERMHYDLLYARRQNLFLDLLIFFKTPWWMMGMKNK